MLFKRTYLKTSVWGRSINLYFCFYYSIFCEIQPCFWFCNFGWGDVEVRGLWFNMCITSGLLLRPLLLSSTLLEGRIIFLFYLLQRDVKSWIAYSSVAHIELVVCTFTVWGIVGYSAIMLAHSLYCSGLFRLVNINYERISNRTIMINKGLIILYPRFHFVHFCFALQIWLLSLLLICFLSIKHSIFNINFSFYGLLNWIEYNNERKVFESESVQWSSTFSLMRNNLLCNNSKVIDFLKMLLYNMLTSIVFWRQRRKDLEIILKYIFYILHFFKQLPIFKFIDCLLGWINYFFQLF